jgi:ABC-2 family transporter protein
MTFLPIVARELRVASRRWETYWVRCGAALVLLGLGAWYFLVRPGLAPHELAVGLFWGLTGSVVLYCLLKGVWSTADCLSEEKREGTLGLLFLTDLKGYDVVLGKLAATSLNGLYAVLAAVPILALPLLMGGVAPGEVGRMALVAVNTLFFSLAIGMCVSAVSRSPFKAMALTLGLIFFFAAGLPAWGAGLSLFGWTPKLSKGWFLASAGYSYYTALDVPYLMGQEQFWRSLAVIHGLGWVFLLLACVIAPYSWQTRPAGVKALRWRERWRGWSYGNPEERRNFRRRLLERSAYFWLAARARLKPAYVWAVLGVVACGWVWGLARSGRDWLDEGTYVLTGLLLNVVIKVWFALEAGRQLAEDRKQGALELLLSTPLTVQDVLQGQLLALKRQFKWPVLAVLVVFGSLLVAGVFDAASQEDAEARTLWALFWAAGMLMLITDLDGLYWLGMWRGLTAKSAVRAVADNVACILVLPWACAILVVLAASVVWHNAQNAPILKCLLGLWFGLGLVVDFGFGTWARHRLLTDFRVAATRRFERPVGFWKRLLRASSQTLP